MKVKVYKGPLGEYSPTLQNNWIVLGYLQEYRGYSIGEESTFVDRFFANEQTEANHFEIRLNQLLQDLGSPEAVNRENYDTGHVGFSNSAVAGMIREFFNPDFTQGTRTSTDFSGNTSRVRTVGIEVDHFPARGTVSRVEFLDARFSYLLGVYERYSRGSKLIFANASHKVEVVKQLLIDCWCATISHKMKGLRGAPCVHELEFECDFLHEFLVQNSLGD